VRKNLAVLMSSGNKEWETPRDLFETVSSNVGGFAIDIAATPKNALCRYYYTENDDALADGSGWSHLGRGPYWCNPPYGLGIYHWTEKAVAQQLIGNFGVFLLPARTDTRWFHDHVYRQPGVSFELIRGRLMFTLGGKPILDKKGKPTSATFPSVLISYGPMI